jgi:hypothetical protein
VECNQATAKTAIAKARLFEDVTPATIENEKKETAFSVSH